MDQGPRRMGGLPFPAPGLPAGSSASLVLTPPSFPPRRPCCLQEAQGPATFLEPLPEVEPVTLSLPED